MSRRRGAALDEQAGEQHDEHTDPHAAYRPQHPVAQAAVIVLVIGLAAIIALVVFQVRWIIRSRFPTLRAIEALATSVPLYLLLFAGTYVVLATLSVKSFGEHLSHTKGLYFTVSVFSTVGFGDITARTETARLVVTGQMIADLIILGLIIKVVVGAVRRGRIGRAHTSSTMTRLEKR